MCLSNYVAMLIKKINTYDILTIFFALGFEPRAQCSSHMAVALTKVLKKEIKGIVFCCLFKGQQTTVNGQQILGMRCLNLLKA